MDNQDAHDAPVINSVSVKVPPFWPDEPVLWFAQIESQFTLANITADTTKYNYVVSNLDYKYVSEIKDIIKNPPTTDKYISLKTELISRLSSSQEQRVRQLLTHEDIGDRKPSQFLRHLQNLAGPEIPDDFIRSIWSSRLPTNIQVIIASQPKSSLDSLASLADAVTDVMCQPQINHVASPHDEIKELRNCVAELTKQVAALSTSTSRRPRSRSGQRAYESRRRSHSHGRSRDVSTSGVCWYHRIFEENATKCRAPCTSRYHILLTEFPEVTKPSGEPEVREIKHKTLHYIRTTPGPPVFSRPRRLAPDRLRRAKREFEDMVRTGIRSAWKEDISSSSAELLYGEGLRLPGDLFISSGTEITDHSDFLSRLRQHISQLKPTPVMRHGKAKTFVHKDLKQATSVFLRQDAVRKSLKPPYSGPYKVLDRTDKTMRIEMDGKTTTVSIDRVKPAHILTEEEPINNTIAVPSMPPAKKPDYVTRSGRRVRFPRHLYDL
ncbi:unnamed protein product [Pieris brassicae]|uniref:DUF7041 domain-containing protein n=1 Tax=Pieris brassicae TaxID=7116 RepID=A0A9P0X6M4_PIEBR|nr:unnamed protein product [Pieris brassicae]